MSDKIYDALVIGSGAAGSFAVKELTSQGLSVLLLEAGPEIGKKDFDRGRKSAASGAINIWERARATLTGQPIQARAAFFKERFSHFFVNDRKNPYTTPANEPFLWIRGRQAGGRLHSFGRCLLRWSDDDFKIQTRFGKGVDWPISYDDLSHFYAEIESYLGLYGNTDGVSTLPDGVYSYSAKLSAAETLFKTKLEKEMPGQHGVSWRYIAPEPERVPRPLRDAQASGKLDIRYNAVVSRITTDSLTGLATGAEFTDRQTAEKATVLARNVVLCASPIESIRLLLNSRGGQHENGIGNSTGLLGRYFMDQIPCLAFGTFPKARGWTVDDSAPVDEFYDPSGGIYITRPEIGGAAIAGQDFTFQGSVGRTPVAAGEPSAMSFFGFGLMLPHENNRVTIDPQRKDAWGNPVPRIRCVMHEPEHELLSRQEKALAELIETVGGELNFVGSPRGLREIGKGAFPEADPVSRFLFRAWFKKTMCLGAAIHESGGARMGTDRNNSVLNNWNQCWDAPNLLVTDASAFPGGGTVGTTLTVMAMTVRACRRLAQA